jgi:transglutaminase-like putative cysteine protease
MRVEGAELNCNRGKGIGRREFLRIAGTAAPAALGLGSMPGLSGQSSWRTFEIVTRVDVLKPAGATRIWIPGPLLTETPYQRGLSTSFQVEGGEAQEVKSAPDGLHMIAARLPADAAPRITVTSRIATRNWEVDLASRGSAPKLGAADRQYWLRATKLLPTDGIVRETADSITRRAKNDFDKARAIYEWIVENTYRDPKVRGCGLGNIRFLLESRDLGGKCADLNALFVGLARAAGLPARDVYGIRVAKSDLGYKSLGTSSEVISKAQHCRAEVYLEAFGWVPVDPADVRKVMLEEPPGNRPAGDETVRKARARLFGSWEMNWMAYNFAHDVPLPGSNGRQVGYLMYPQAETADGPLDSLDPDAFRYEIASREIAAA